MLFTVQMVFKYRETGFLKPFTTPQSSDLILGKICITHISRTYILLYIYMFIIIIIIKRFLTILSYMKKN